MPGTITSEAFMLDKISHLVNTLIRAEFRIVYLARKNGRDRNRERMKEARTD